MAKAQLLSKIAECWLGQEAPSVWEIAEYPNNVFKSHEATGVRLDFHSHSVYGDVKEENKKAWGHSCV